MDTTVKDLLERIEMNALLYFQTGDERFFKSVEASKKEVSNRFNELEENLNEIHEIVGDFYSEGIEVKRLPNHLSHIAGELSVIYTVSRKG